MSATISLSAGCLEFGPLQEDAGWRYNLKGRVLSPIRLRNGNIYSTGGADLAAIESSSGEAKVLHSGEQLFGWGLSVDENRIYAGFREEGLSCYRRSSGELVWSLDASRIGIVSNVVSREGDLFVTDFSGGIYRIATRSGEGRWSTRTDQRLNSGLAFYDDKILAGGESGEVHSTHVGTGEIEWTVRTSGQVNGTPVVSNGTAYVGTTAGTLHAIDLQEGQETWSQSVGETCSAPAIVDGMAYLSTDEQYVKAIDLTNRTELWRYEPFGGSVFRPLVHGKRIYANGLTGTHCIERADGSRVWYTEFDDPLYTPITDGERLYVGTYGGTVAALPL